MCDRVVVMNLGEVVLDTRMQDAAAASRVHVLRLKDAPDEQTRLSAAALPGVEKVEQLEAATLRIEHDGNVQTLDGIVASLSSLGVRELRPERGTLEQLFANLTQGAPANISPHAKVPSC